MFKNLINVGGVVYSVTMNQLEEELLSLKASVEADGFSGSSDDENPDPRMVRVSEIITILECFYWEDYKRILIANFGVPASHFLD